MFPIRNIVTIHRSIAWGRLAFKRSAHLPVAMVLVWLGRLSYSFNLISYSYSFLERLSPPTIEIK